MSNRRKRKRQENEEAQRKLRNLIYEAKCLNGHKGYLRIHEEESLGGETLYGRRCTVPDCGAGPAPEEGEVDG